MLPSCSTAPPLRLSAAELALIQSADAANLGKQAISPAQVRAADGSSCKGRSADGVLSTFAGCTDLGEPAALLAAADGSHTKSAVGGAVAGVAHPRSGVSSRRMG